MNVAGLFSPFLAALLADLGKPCDNGSDHQTCLALFGHHGSWFFPASHHCFADEQGRKLCAVAGHRQKRHRSTDRQDNFSDVPQASPHLSAQATSSPMIKPDSPHPSANMQSKATANQSSQADGDNSAEGLPMCDQPVAVPRQQADAECSQEEPPCKRLKFGDEHLSEDVAHGLVTALVTDLINNLVTVTDKNMLPGMRGWSTH